MAAASGNGDRVTFPTSPNNLYGLSTQIASLQGHVADLYREREIDRRHLAMLMDWNRSLDTQIVKLSTSDQQANNLTAEPCSQYSISILAWDLHRSQAECARLTERMIRQQQTIESQSSHIAMLNREIANTRQTIESTVPGRGLRDLSGSLGSVGDTGTTGVGHS